MPDVVIVWTMNGRAEPVVRGVFSDAGNAERFLQDLSAAERKWSYATTHTLDVAYLHAPFDEPFPPIGATTAATAA